MIPKSISKSLKIKGWRISYFIRQPLIKFSLKRAYYSKALLSLRRLQKNRRYANRKGNCGIELALRDGLYISRFHRA
jgi:hypothetical protein